MDVFKYISYIKVYVGNIINTMDWDLYFMQIADVVSKRSPDIHTKHGCVLVDANNRIISTGYNGPIKGLPNDIVPTNRPHKYLWMMHAEDNAVLFAKCDLEGTTAYITGHPCAACFRRIVQAGVKRVVYGMTMSSCIDSDDLKMCDTVARAMNIEMLNIEDI